MGTTLALALALAACDRARPPADAQQSGSAAGGAELAACTGCHGDPAHGNAAPPASLRGGADPSDPGVGAHQAHLTAGALRGAVSCGECHVVPSTVFSAGHANGSVEVDFGPLARAAGAAASWDPIGLTCATYCHGATLSGGTDTRPIWTQGSSQPACGSCHGLPPPASAGHPAASADLAGCAACHPDTVTRAGAIDLEKGKHIDGVVDLSCTSCHGGALSGGTGAAGANPVAAAPPRGTRGETDTGSSAVGLHASHLTSQRFTTSVTCAACHVVPTTASHADGTAAVTFGGLATAGGAPAAWSGASCSDVYCHGSFAGGAGASPLAWASATVPAIGCTSCHAIPPATGQHGRHAGFGVVPCFECHGTGYSTAAVNAATHLDGVKSVGGAGSRVASYDRATRLCGPACHDPQHW